MRWIFQRRKKKREGFENKWNKEEYDTVVGFAGDVGMVTEVSSRKMNYAVPEREKKRIDGNNSPCCAFVVVLWTEMLINHPYPVATIRAIVCVDFIDVFFFFSLLIVVNVMIDDDVVKCSRCHCMCIDIERNHYFLIPRLIVLLFFFVLSFLRLCLI